MHSFAYLYWSTFELTKLIYNNSMALLSLTYSISAHHIHSSVAIFWYLCKSYKMFCLAYQPQYTKYYINNSEH